MTDLLPELSSLPVEGVFDGELVAFGDDALPSFDRLSRRILHREASCLDDQPDREHADDCDLEDPHHHLHLR
jgi:hypothetical protein